MLHARCAIRGQNADIASIGEEDALNTPIVSSLNYIVCSERVYIKARMATGPLTLKSIMTNRLLPASRLHDVFNRFAFDSGL